MKTDIEIARSTPLVPVSEIAGQVGIPQDSLENYGKYVAKVPESLSDNSKIKADEMQNRIIYYGEGER